MAINFSTRSWVVTGAICCKVARTSSSVTGLIACAMTTLLEASGTYFVAEDETFFDDGVLFSLTVDGPVDLESCHKQRKLK